MMTKLVTLGIMALALAIRVPNAALAQAAKDFVGTWTIVSAVTVRDGATSDIFGPNPKGILVFDGNGRYALTLIGADLPKFAANNRAGGTADENKAVVAGSLAHFGTYAVDEANKSFTFHIEFATFPNWTNTDQKRAFTITGDELKYTDPNASAGGRATVIWRRAK
jgi:hypothetical protein